VLVGDGMADRPVGELGGRTPLEAAGTPNMDDVVRSGQLGIARMVPPGFPPGSDVAVLSILGYDPGRYYTGRAPLEAAKLGIELSGELVAFRCNLITAGDGRIADYSAGHISSSEAAELISFLDRELGEDRIKFYAGVSYRHICVMEGDHLAGLNCVPPHDVVGQSLEANLPQGRGAEGLVRIMRRSYDLLRDHQVNRARVGRGQNPGNMVWLWGQGKAPALPSFKDCYGVGGGVISAVDLVKGLAKLIGLDPIEVPGATGYYDTNYEAKTDYAVKCLDRESFVLVHVEAPDEASHNGDLEEKIRAIENFDRLVVGPIKERLAREPAFRMLVLPDHPTPIELRTHSGDPVPFALCGHGVERDEAEAFDEQRASGSSLRFDDGYRLMEHFIKGKEC